MNQEPVCIFESEREIDALAVRDLLIQEGLHAVILLRERLWNPYFEVGDQGLGNGISHSHTGVYVPQDQASTAIEQVKGFFDPQAAILPELDDATTG